MLIHLNFTLIERHQHIFSSVSFLGAWVCVFTRACECQIKAVYAMWRRLTHALSQNKMTIRNSDKRERTNTHRHTCTIRLLGIDDPNTVCFAWIASVQFLCLFERLEIMKMWISKIIKTLSNDEWMEMISKRHSFGMSIRFHKWTYQQKSTHTAPNTLRDTLYLQIKCSCFS